MEQDEEELKRLKQYRKAAAGVVSALLKTYPIDSQYNFELCVNILLGALCSILKTMVSKEQVKDLAKSLAQAAEKILLGAFEEEENNNQQEDI